MGELLTFTGADEMLTRALAYRGSDYRAGDMVVAWATAALAEGLESSSLVTLAGLDPAEEFEIEKYLGAALDELSIARPTAADALWSYVHLVAERTAEGAVAAGPALAELYALFDETNCDARLTPFVYLADDLERLSLGDEPLFFPGLDPGRMDEIVRAEARKLLSTTGDRR